MSWFYHNFLPWWTWNKFSLTFAHTALSIILPLSSQWDSSDYTTWHAKLFVIHSLLFVFILLFIMFEEEEWEGKYLKNYPLMFKTAIIIFIAWMSSDNPPLFFAVQGLKESDTQINIIILKLWHTQSSRPKAYSFIIDSLSSFISISIFLQGLLRILSYAEKEREAHCRRIKT